MSPPVSESATVTIPIQQLLDETSKRAEGPLTERSVTDTNAGSARPSATENMEITVPMEQRSSRDGNNTNMQNSLSGEAGPTLLTTHNSNTAPATTGEQKSNEASETSSEVGSTASATDQGRIRRRRALANARPLTPQRVSRPSQEQVGMVIKKLTTKMYTDVKYSANRQGVSAYARSFGTFGILSRIGAQVVANTATSAVTTLLASSATALSMPLVHAAAGKAAAPGRDRSHFVNPVGNKHSLPHNTGGKAFHPFVEGLSIHNSAVTTAVEIPLAVINRAKDGLSAQSISGSEISAKERNAATGIKNGLSFIPGAIAGSHTARNIYHAQAEANFSLQQPINNSNGRLTGALVTHQEPSPSNGPIINGEQWQELGTIELDIDGKRHKALVIKNPNNDTVEIFRDTNTAPKDVKKEAGNIAAKAMEFGVDLAKGTGAAIRTTLTPSTQSAIKVTALAATLAANSVVGPAVKAIASEILQNSMPASVAEPLATIASAMVTNHMLGNVFIPVFKTFGNAIDTPGDTPALTLGKNLVRVGAAAIPIFGGRIANYYNPTHKEAPVDLSSGDFENLATRQADMLLGLRTTQNNNNPVVELNSDNELTLNAENLKSFFLNNPAATDESPV